MELMLLQLYKRYEEYFKDPYSKKTAIWDTFANAINDMNKTPTKLTGIQAQSKWKYILNKYKAIKSCKTEMTTNWHLFHQMNDDMLQCHVGRKTLKTEKRPKKNPDLKLQESIDNIADSTTSNIERPKKRKVARSSNILLAYIKETRVEDKHERDQNMEEMQQMHCERLALMQKFLNVFESWKDWKNYIFIWATISVCNIV